MSPIRAAVPNPARTRRLGRAYNVVDIVATLLFSIEGAAAGYAAPGIDAVGVLVVAFSTALVGGILRDVLLGETPPAAFRSPARIIVAFSGGLIVILFQPVAAQVGSALVIYLDAAAMSLFAVTGALKALSLRSNAVVAVVLGTLTAVGGGVVRDVLLNRVPYVMSTSIYATAAAAGALVVVVMLRTRAPAPVAMIAGGLVCLILRLCAVEFDWNLQFTR